MSTLSQVIRQHSTASHADIEWLNLLTTEWQLIADLTFADLVLWVPTKNDSFIAVANARASGAATIFYRDISGEEVRKMWAPQVQEAFRVGEIVDAFHLSSFDGIQSRFAAFPVKRREVMSREPVHAKPIAVITRHTNLNESQIPNKLQLNYLHAGNDLLRMVSEGTFPDLAEVTGSKRGNPRANDGLLRLDPSGKVTFASPNALGAFARLGVDDELESTNLSEQVTALVSSQAANQISADEALPLVVSGKAPWRIDLGSPSGTLSLRSIPLKSRGERIGALILCRDVTELRSQERELITKDATIREIHHRVKNNLQTVASLLRLQARRSKSADTKEALDQAMRRVAAIAMVHETLSSGLAQDVNFDEVFERILQLATELASTHGSTISTIKDGKFGKLRSETATTLAVVLTELVGNAVEHGIADRGGAIHVVAERRTKKLEISVSDNGRGLPNGQIGTGLGTQIVRTLVEGELRGSIKWFSPSEGGTRAVVAMPI